MAEKNVKFYKTKDGTIVVCKDEVARQQIEQLQGIWEAIEELPDGQAVSAQVAIHTTEIAALQSGKANINGSYEGMTVGMAKNIEAREIVSGIFTHRPTAGNVECATGAAKVRSIKGNSVAWGQLVSNPNVTVTFESRPTIGSISIISGHKYYFHIKTSRARVGIGNNDYQIYTTGAKNMYHIEGNSTENSFITDIPTGILNIYTAVYDNFEGNVDIAMFVIDLTLMFGAGNEPATAEAFEAWLQATVGLRPYYAYNAGELLSAKMLGMKTVGFNQWDEQWEVGFISSTGSLDYDANSIRSKNVCRCIPNTQYYCCKPLSYANYINVCWYDANLAFIGRMEAGSLPIVTSPANAAYFKISCYGYGTTYNNDICINLSDTNKNGTFELYKEHTYEFDTSKVYGKLGGEGELVQIFPNGMKSAGSVRDELTIKDGVAKVVKRVGSVDLGDLSWNYFSGLVIFTAPQIKGDRSLQGICQAYTYQTGGPLIDKNFSISSSHYGRGTGLVIKDTSYSDAATFKAAMNGVMLYYELTEPVEYTDLVYRDNGVDVPLLDYFSGVILVDNFGTEEQLLESPTNNNPNSCAAGMDIVYGVNAADFIDAANNGSFISKPSQDALLSTLSAALGGTLSATWNEATGHYDYTFTQNRQSNEEPHDD